MLLILPSLDLNIVRISIGICTILIVLQYSSGSNTVVAARSPLSSSASVMIQIFISVGRMYDDRIREPSCKASSFREVAADGMY